MTTRRRLLLLLRRAPGSTVAELADQLGLTGMGVRRHLDALVAEGAVEAVPCPAGGAGRPASRWQLSDAGLELFPRRYDALAVEIMDDLDVVEPGALENALRRRSEKLVGDYREALTGCEDLESRVAGLARLRDQAGYLAEWSTAPDGTLLLTEHNCAIHRVAERHPIVCAAELALLRGVLGPDVEVTRTAHTMAGDTTCTYCIRRREDGPSATS